IAERTGDVASATASYQTIASGDARLAQYALWRLAKIARATGDLVLERERLQRLVATTPGSILFEAATLRLSESFSESKDFLAAANSAKPLLLSKNAATVREGMALMGTAYVRSEKTTEARDVFTKLIMQMPDASRPDDFALEAVRQLDQLDKGPAPNLSEADLLLRASIYQFNRDFAGARVHYQALIDRFPQSTTAPNAIFQIARGLYQESKFDEAVKLFRKVFDTYPESSSAREALGFVGSSYNRLKRTDDAVNAYKLLIDRFPDAPSPERPYLNLIDALHEAGRYSEALNWVQQTRTRFKNDLGGTLALFAQLRIHMAQGSWATVVRDADEMLKISELGGTRVPGGTTSAEVTFLRAYALEQSGQLEDAISGYLVIPDGRNEYYGWRATQRLLLLANNEKARSLIRTRLNMLRSTENSLTRSSGITGQLTDEQRSLRLTNDPQTRADILRSMQSIYGVIPSYRLPKFTKISLVTNSDSIADNLFLLGLYDEALPEFLAKRVPANRSSLSDEDYTIAVLSLRAGNPNLAVRFAEQLWRSLPPDYLIDLAPRELLELLYPAPFRASLVQHAASRNVDPRFVLAIARQESRFQADAKSVAAARGMMQFISATADQMAVQLKLQNFTQDDLYNPDTAILFGSQYLANLFQQFPDQPQAVAGSYNGGADNLARWIARSRSTEPDRYVPEIGFSQTKDYVYKVMSNYWTYQRLYDAQLNPITTK
ncbi:MAG TPA: transglycosylase SLT domain-containing protein, partial [Pyrinomonadaceae bacterium]|nr:transglycosylase SLT domain-containing protein [Pyrinomonadaceae bacterium]